MDKKRENWDATMRDGKTPRCQEQVCTYSGMWPHYHQCSRSAKVGDRCRQHDPVAIKARADKTQAKYDADWQRRRYEIYGKGHFEALVKIANGHNDARGLARELVDKFNE